MNDNYDNEELENNLPQEDEQNEKRNTISDNIKNQATDKAKKEIKKKMTKTAAKSAAKHSALTALGPILFWVIVVILIIIIIVGIVMFFITMPGMVMDKLKELAKNIADDFASFFGGDTTTFIENQAIYDTLDYLEQMGYDLKGYGFLTDYVEDSKDGVERNDEDKISKAYSDFIFTYLVSDNYVYTIKNLNIVTNNWFDGLCAQIASLFTLGGSNQYWSRGMIDIWKDNGVIGKESEYYSAFELGSIKIDPDQKTMQIKRGWGNNSMTYNLDGWTGRYGMPIDFLLSVHLATMMPDLSYDMATGFETVIKLLLHPIGGGEEGSNTAIGYYKYGDGASDYATYDDFKEAATSGKTGSLNAWRMSKKEAKDLMNKFNIKSPDDCIGVADVGEDELEKSNNTIDMRYSDGILSYKRITDDGYDSSEKAVAKKQEVVNTYNAMIQKLKEYGATDEIIKNAGLETSISTFDSFLEMQETAESIAENTYIEPSKNFSTELGWATPEGTADYSYYSVEVILEYNNFDYQIEDAHANYMSDMNFCINTAVINYKIIGEWSNEKLQAWLDENDINTIDEARCNNLHDEDECCEVCRDYIQSIYDELKDVDVSNLEIYQPYISRVINHWYRDVYFVTTDDIRSFVENDYEYEAIMKERWTLYETYGDENPEKAGEYKLYKIDDNGNYLGLYDGSQEDAEKAGIKVAKKAVMKKIDETADELDWNAIDNQYSAYEIQEASNTAFEQVYPDLPEDDSEYNIKKDIYVKLITTGNIVQTGEGQRTETNSKIKKMFLNNKYFRYDGSAETAEIITELRKKNNIQLGALSDEDLSKTATVNGEVRRVSDYAGEVSLNQDSLNAFSMLENEHTLDADYIYRDFKELVVELGYFKKEELTDETPRLLQFLVPDIGSNGYPNRSIDKNENEFGTMVHSKGDIEANKQFTLMKLISDAIENSSDEEEDNPQNAEVSSSAVSTTVGNISGTTDNTKQFISLGSVKSNSNSTSTSLLSLEEWWAETQKMFDIYKSEGWIYGHSNANTTFETARSHDTDCSIGASWMLQKLGALKENHTFTSALGESGSLVESEACAQDLLNAGAEVIVPSGSANFATAANSGELQPGDVLFYEGHVSIYCGDSYEGSQTTFCWDTGSTEGIQNGGPRDTSWEDRPIKLIVRLPIGNSSLEGSQYEGFVGNEAVVSPVTGILLEYGEYDGTQKDSVSGEIYRTNIDLKYQNQTMNIDNGTNNNTTQVATNLKPEKVGYAKILVLDNENYKKLEKALISSTRWSGNSFISENGDYTSKDIKNLKEDDVKDWTDLEKTLYGYKEFAELYSKFGISGNVIYVEGFSCELPDENFDNQDDNALKTTSPSGEKININTFEKIGLGSFSNGNLNNTDDVLSSLYEPEDKYKLANLVVTEKLNSESKVKDEAVSSIYVNNLRFIKEGTVLGRTLTDRELIVDYRGENYEDYRKGKTSTINTTSDPKDYDKVAGNYLRIIMRDLDKTVVENVEDYMKLDDGDSDKKTEVDWEFYYWLPYESGGIGEKGVATHSGAGACGTVSGPNEVAVGIAQWTALSGESWNNVSEICKWLSEEDASLCAPLKAFSSYSSTQICSSISSLQNAWWSVNEKDPDRFLELQMEYFYEHEFKGWLESSGTEWLLNKSLVAQGTYASLKNWGSNLGWEDVISSSMSDEEIVKALLTKARPIGSTCGTLEARWDSQYVLAKDILSGKFKEVEEWVRTKQPAQYGEGNNSGSLLAFLNNKYFYPYLNYILMGEIYERKS